MPGRRELRGAACGLLGAFISRNNDVGGYWALGKLYAHAQASDVRAILVDLIDSVIVPPNPQFIEMVSLFRRKLLRQLEARSLRNGWVSEACIRVTFAGNESATSADDAFCCSVTLIDDLGNIHVAQASGRCWAHDPTKERKSGRASSASSIDG